MRWRVWCAGVAAALFSACLEEPSFEAEPTVLPIRSVTRTVRLQAAANADTVFVRARWLAGAQTTTISLAICPSLGEQQVRDFPRFGCFVACHDVTASTPVHHDDPLVMFLFEGFGGPLDVWSAAVAPGGETTSTERSITTAGIRLDDAAELRAIGRAEGESRDVVLVHAPISPEPAAPYSLALALHTDGLGERNHYVSLPVELRPTLVPGAGGDTIPAFEDERTFPAEEITAFLPGITSYDFLVGALRGPTGELRRNDQLHGGRRQVATGEEGCRDCHRVRSTDPPPPLQNAGALERLVLRRGGVVGTSILEEPP